MPLLKSSGETLLLLASSTSFLPSQVAYDLTFVSRNCQSTMHVTFAQCAIALYPLQLKKIRDL